jgi:pimeloyl-ACP methyl ester carboxylesterase
VRALVPLLLAAAASADTVHLKSGKRIEGAVVAEDPEVVVNVFNSTVPGMTLGVQRFPKEKVKSIDRTPPPEQEFQRRLLRVKEIGAAIELADWCAANHRREEEELALETALRFDPGHEEARKRLGAKAPRGDWLEQIALAKEYLEADETKRDGVLLRIRGEFPFHERYLRRAWRSAREPRKYQKDRPIALRADKLADNARYTLFVPEGYDPLRPTPLVVGLHGGGAGGADGKLVVGSGAEAMNFYQQQCDARGWICACPTAATAGWGSRPNCDLMDALLEELLAMFNIDENRIYLVGHSMGGGGTWSQGARLPETWAAIAPASSFGVDGIAALERTRTGFYVYHSDDDPRCPVEGVRPQMENLVGTGIDFVYTELPKRGHDFPQEVVDDIFRFFDARTLGRRAGKYRPQVRPLSSFERKISRDEKKYLPPLGAAAEGGEESLADLLKELKTGGGVAEAAVPRLIAHADPKTSASVAKILLKADAGPDVRRYAARVLGGRKAAEELDAIGRVLLVEEEANALLECLAAVGEIGDAAGGEAVLRFLKRRADYLGKRTQGGVISHSDWETILPTMTRACQLISTFAPPNSAAQIGDSVVNGVFLSGSAVRFDTENQQPLPYAQALAEAAFEALGRLGGPDALAALERMRKAGEGTGPSVKPVYGPVSDVSGWARDPRIAGFVTEALSKLGQ